MGLDLRGYVLEPPRVGAANSPFTFTPNVVISDYASYEAAYPYTEANPRTEYHVFVLEDGDLHEATFCWTKNEILPRFDYDGSSQRFKTLPGAALFEAGILLADANTTRLVVPAPPSTDTTSFPIRLSIGTGTGIQMTVALVATSGSFTTPTAGTVQLALDTGELNWAPADLVTYAGQQVRFQRQTFYSFKESSGRIGLIDAVLLLNPLPATGQFPLIRIGYGFYLTPIERANEAGFSGNPTAGTVEWARNTGRLKFNAGEATSNTGKAIFYDGIVHSFRQTLTPITLGTVSSPGTLSPIPSEESDLFFRLSSGVQFSQVVFVDAIDPMGKFGQVQVLRGVGTVSFSFFDQALYGAQTVQAIVPDLPIERGMSARWFRNQVDLDGNDATLKDVASLYETTDAVMADPLVGSPQIILPSRPVESMPITVKVEQGTGSFTGTLTNMAVPSPPIGIGYIIDFEKQELRFAQRKNNVVIPGAIRKPYGSVQLSDPLVFPNSLVLELETSPGSNTYAALTLGVDAIMDYNAGVVQFVETDGLILASGSAASSAGSVLTDGTVDFVAAGVAIGDFLVVPSGSAEGVYTITAVTTNTVTADFPLGTLPSLQYAVHTGKEILADRFFQEVPPIDPNTRVEKIQELGVADNSPRLVLLANTLESSRIRFGKTTFAELTIVPDSGSFSSPGSVPSGTVEVAEDTGELNFRTADLGQTAYWARTLTLNTDYKIQPGLGFIEFTDRMLEKEEVFVRYAVIGENDEKEIVEERVPFLVPKELVQASSTPTSTFSFNPLGREVAATPPPAAFRGGRPQVTGQQVSFNVAASTVTFLPSLQKTDALPSGPVVRPIERVLVDYYIYEAIGGEKNVTVLRSPMFSMPVVINEGDTSFMITGDRRSSFPAGYLLKVDRTDLYMLAAPTYDSSTDMTTVNLSAPQTFRGDFNGPVLAVSSGIIRTTTTPLFPAYFVPEMTTFESVPRGANRVKFIGDVAKAYPQGTVLLWTSGVTIFEMSLVEGATYDEESDRTEVVLAANGSRQYTAGSITPRRSVRPILETALGVVNTAKSPNLSLPYEVFRRVEGEVGRILKQPDDYTIDEAGRVQVVSPLLPNEELSIFYTGATVISDGRSFRGSYTYTVVPSETNGLANQVLKMDYVTFAPDTMYWRVETISTYRIELAAKYDADAQASIPTGGPRLSNSPAPKLYKQGRESIFFDEGRYANEDIIAVPTLKFFNDAVNYLEDVLQNMDGRVVGDHDGRFKFDGILTNPLRASYADMTNHIDDRIKVSDGPPLITYPPLAVSFLGTYLEAYKPSKFSRFFPTFRRMCNVAIDSTGFETGDTILDTGFKSFAKVNQIVRRQPWAILTKPAKVGDYIFEVDTTDGAQEMFRPPFDMAYQHLVVLQAPDGTFAFPLLDPATLLAKTTTTMSLSKTTPIAMPVGSTIYHIPVYYPPIVPAPQSPDVPYLKFYRLGFDLDVELDDGTLTYVEPFPPFDGSFPVLPKELECQAPLGGEPLDVTAQMSNKITEPNRFPALDGGTADDDNNRQFPIISPAADSEFAANVGYGTQEKTLIQSGGRIRTNTQAPYIGTGSLDAARTLLTNSVNWPAPIPKIHDLVEIQTGLNALSGFHRITAVTANTITVATPFALQDSGFTFTVTVSSFTFVSSSGLATLTTTTNLTDNTVNFTLVKPGDTLVVLSGAKTGLRRQVVSVPTVNSLVLSPFPSSGGITTYRIDKAFNTHGGTNSLIDDLSTALANNITLQTLNAPPKPYASVTALSLFFDHMFTNITTGTLGQTTIGLPNLTDGSQNFIAAGVTISHYIYIQTGSTAGIYKIISVGAGALTVDTNFPATATNISYRVVKVDVLSKDSLVKLFAIYQALTTYLAQLQAFKIYVDTAPAPVVDDAGAYANRYTHAAFDTRVTEIDARYTSIFDVGTGALTTISSILSSGEQLYERRFVWIDARVNLEKGILPGKERAVEVRNKAKKDLRKQLIKRLSVMP